MIIPINIPSSGSPSIGHIFPPQLAQFGSEELVLIELQGSLEVEGDREDQIIGELRVDAATKKPTLLIRHHLLEGKLVNLPKPLAVLHRPLPDSNDNTDGNEDDRSMYNQIEVQAQSAQKGWDVVAVVKRKMVFSKRPMPMMGKVPVLASDSKSAKQAR